MRTYGVLTSIVGFLLSAGVVRLSAQDSPWLYGIHWYGEHLPTSPDNGAVEAMTGGKGIWVLETVLTEDRGGEWGVDRQIDRIREARRRGHTIIVRIQPRWGVVVPGPGQMDAFVADVRDAARRLSDSVHIWQIGNEMNLPWEYQHQIGEELTPALYVEKFRRIRETILPVPSSLGPQIVLLGPVAPLAENYLKGMLQNLAPDDVDGFALHAYGGALGNFMEQVTIQARWIDEFRDKGFDRKPIYLTEWGAPVRGLSDTNEKATAAFLLDSFQALADYNDLARHPGNHPIVAAMWFVYKRDAQWREWSILDLRDRNARGVGLDLYDTFREACRRNLPAGEDFLEQGPDLRIGRTPSSLTATAVEGLDAPEATFTVFRTGSGTLRYEISTGVPWLSVSPANGSSDGEEDTIRVRFHTGALSVGRHAGSIVIHDPAAVNSPATVAVELNVTSSVPLTVIANPNFEEDFPRSFSVASGWSSFGGNKWEQVYGSQHGFSQGIADVPPGGSGGVFQSLAVLPRARYRVSASGLSQTTSYEVAIGVDPEGGVDDDAASFGASSSSASWTGLGHEFTATTGSATLFLRARSKVGDWVPGHWALFDAVRIELIGSGGNLPPEVSLVRPAHGDRFTAPAAITLEAEASDPDGAVARVEFFRGGISLGQDSTPPFSVTIGGVMAGNHTLSARATDDGGANADSSPVVVTVTSVDDPPPPGASKSKLSIHTGFTGPLSMQFLRDAKPRVVKILDSFGQAAEIKQLSPQTQIIGRIFLASQPMDGSPAQRAQEWWDRTRHLILQYPAVDYWEGYNEPVIQNTALMRWYAEFERARVLLLAQNGRKAVIGSFSTGNPDLPLWPEFFPAIDAARGEGGILGLHEYGTPMQQFYEAPLAEGWLCGRYRKVYRQHLIPNGRTIPLAITETGVDVVPPVGWKNHFTGEEYFSQLLWYDSLLLEDDYVLGATIFSLEIPNWNDFDIAPIMGLVTQHVRDGTGNVPPVLTLTSPRAGETFTAPATISIAASATDADGTVAKVEFFQGSQKLGEDASPPYSLSWTEVPVGTYPLTARATDDRGAVGTSSAVTVSVGAGSPPSNRLGNGDFSQGLTGWSTWTERGTLQTSVANGQLHLSGTSHNGGVYQTFPTGGAGKTIQIDGFWASGPNAPIQWAEVLVINGSGLPVNGLDLKADGARVLLIYKNDSASWSGSMRGTTTVPSAGAFIAAGDVATLVLKTGTVLGRTSGGIWDEIAAR